MSRAAQRPIHTILALDTALGACSVAIRQKGATLASAFELRQTGHAEALMPMIANVCAKAGLSLNDIDIFAVTLGPGTFTGLRIGLAAARGLAQSLDRPLMGFSTLEVIGWGALASLSAPLRAGNLMVVHDARRAEVYAQSFSLGPGPVLTATTPPVLLSLDQLGSFAPTGPLWLAGSGAILALDQLPQDVEAETLSDALVNPDAAILAALAARQLDAGDPAIRPEGYLGLPPVAPVYLRAPDAKLPGGASF